MSALSSPLLTELDENRRIAAQLREASDLLHAQGANPFRVAAYLRASGVVDRLERPLREIFDANGTGGLQALPAIGAGIAAAIAEMLVTGRWAVLCRLRGEAGAEAHAAAPLEHWPSLDTILDVDREYRVKAAGGKLPVIAPKRFNPEGHSWLPVLHTRRGEWHFTALYSNTERAHQLDRWHDWVVIYFHDGDQREHQCTVVTESHGGLAGNRVVRGRSPAGLPGHTERQHHPRTSLSG